ncbi:cryptochrome/photolyase family protein [Kibdelosporangium phytohabitans]|uniref:Deoxyribodipyrimidine photo-lyase n=1 Tax=Kibdelosporangium phytohabitans TaxID=860235 RepID=A0A0N9HT75_9PSEU|nr:deoxyribodipyrimidine photo-lyase [Kibdelosporangium phytohabitans]ALG06091.1 deoxyribodipyrimidine photolyase [Kibdelosporangium phytohabitans]MBE1465823.1 deoxyribodipyrimidine photo-lyase [Kibdelosporangium phytohabitans]
MTSVVWFRRDLRTRDLPTLLSADKDALALFVLDKRLTEPSGAARLAFLYRCLRDLDEQLDGRLLVVSGDPVELVPRIAKQIDATSVHVSADYAPYGRERDDKVEAALGDIDFVRSGSPYAVAPGRVTKPDGTPYKVFTPFSRAWADHGWRKPADTDASTVDWIEPPRTSRIPKDPAGVPELPGAGEAAALAAWEKFRDERVDGYSENRNRPDRPGTSWMSPYLRWGCVHPRTLLGDLTPGPYRNELAWREFYADVLWHKPDSARQNLDRRFDKIELDDDREAFDAWCQGMTGFPIVDAGMRQLLELGWMHNRVRMVVASFLVKDLHLPWWWGARHFMKHLVDGDLASNQHNWQWAAGSGTDAAPYFRVFNPTTQGEKFDPNGDYVRRFVPELRGVTGKRVHKPWEIDGIDYPKPIVDHAHEREVALARYNSIKSQPGS